MEKVPKKILERSIIDKDWEEIEKDLGFDNSRFNEWGWNPKYGIRKLPKIVKDNLTPYYLRKRD